MPPNIISIAPEFCCSPARKHTATSWGSFNLQLAAERRTSRKSLSRRFSGPLDSQGYGLLACPLCFRPNSSTTLSVQTLKQLCRVFSSMIRSQYKSSSPPRLSNALCRSARLFTPAAQDRDPAPPTTLTLELPSVSIHTLFETDTDTINL